MNNGNSQPEASGNRLDADAFCIVCSSVNPEGTLICKTCGNNLRDQKSQRVAGGGPVDMPVMEEERTAWLPKLLVIVLILAVLWTAMNLGDIEEWLVGAQAGDVAIAEEFWQGPSATVLDEMAEELKSSPLTEEEKDAARNAIQEAAAGAAMEDSVEGRYLIVREGGLPGDLGEAVVRQLDAERVVFVALIKGGTAEVRGEGYLEGGTKVAARDSAGLMLNGRQYNALGFATYGGAGMFTCAGTCDLNDTIYGALAVHAR